MPRCFNEGCSQPQKTWGLQPLVAPDERSGGVKVARADAAVPTKTLRQSPTQSWCAVDSVAGGGNDNSSNYVTVSHVEIS